ncbi:TetR/AcrR family transcriptional regulator [Chryseobacterium tongliaoense]|uniref:TetR/AcrR family transcriptional regulator n=1 Tax=Chryseobacterium tongliaoense TaxID=3240933 RepID=UPI003511B8A0
MLTKAEKTKQFILHTAAPIYNQKGISGVSIDDVLAATKLTKGCLYSHFENKEDLTNQVVDLLLKKISDQMRLEVAKGKTVKGKLFNFLDFYKDPIQTFVPGGCPIINTAAEVDDNFPLIKEKVASVFRAGQEDLTNLLKQGIEDGEFSKELEPSVIAFKIVAAVEGGIVMCRVMNSAKPMVSLIKNLKAELDQYSN